MTRQLKKAFEEASKLPERDQDELAQFVLVEITSERRWSEAFTGSGTRLQELADEASTEHEQGSTIALDPVKPSMA
jgi:hypothetical protein